MTAIAVCFITACGNGGNKKTDQENSVEKKEEIKHSSVKSDKPLIGYDEVSWGTTIDEVKQFYPNMKEKEKKDGIRSFTEIVNKNGMQYRYFYFFQDKLYKVSLDYDANLRYPLVDKLTSIYGKFESITDFYTNKYDEHLYIDISVIDDVEDSFIAVTYEDPTIVKKIDKIKEDAEVL